MCVESIMSLGPQRDESNQSEAYTYQPTSVGIDEFDLYSGIIPLYHVILRIYNIFQHEYNVYEALYDHILIVHQEIYQYICRAAGDIRCVCGDILPSLPSKLRSRSVGAPYSRSNTNFFFQIFAPQIAHAYCTR